MRSSAMLPALILAGASLVLTPAANAQNQQTQSPTAPSATAPNQTGPSAQISDQKLDAAAKAVKGVSAIEESYEQKLAAAPQPDRGRLADEADAAMAKAVTDQGLTVEEYTAILKVAQNDPVVHEKIIQRLK